MEAKNKLCLLRDIYRTIREFELDFQTKHDLCLNEGMTLCSLYRGRRSSSDLAERLGLTASNMSKVIKSVEEKGFIKRILGEEDRRHMYFILSSKGEQKLNEIKNEEATIELILASIYETQRSFDYKNL